MKTMLRVAFAAVALFGFGQANAFHSGGVAECGGCHSMHSPAANGSSLLVGNDQSSTCLSCHEHAGDTGPSSYHVSTADADLLPGVAPLQRTPGGDFGWLKKNYTFVVRGETIEELGHEFGHNIVAIDNGYTAETGTSPGGTYPAANLNCVSCHDMHGQNRRDNAGNVFIPSATSGAYPIVQSGSYANGLGMGGTNRALPANQAVGVYRLLWGANGGFAGVPAAVAPNTYNRRESTSDTRVAYGVSTATGHTTWGNWCGECHGAMHSTGNYVHPVDQSLGTTVIGNYNAYISSGNLGGTTASAFLSLAPYVENSGDYTVLAAQARRGTGDAPNLAGPNDADQVSCMSCHRAHASGFPWMLRWQMEGEFITVADTSGGTTPIWPGTDNLAPVQFARGRTAIEQQGAYYDRPATRFGVYQRVLCNKCHAKD